MDLPSLVPDRGEREEIGISFGSRQFWGRVPREATHATCGMGLHVRRPRRWVTIVYVIWETNLPLSPREVVLPVAHCKRPERSLRLRIAARLGTGSGQFYRSRGHVLKPSWSRTLRRASCWFRIRYAMSAGTWFNFFFFDSWTNLCTFSLMTLKLTLSASWANVGGVPIIIVDDKVNSQASQDRH